MSSGSAFTPAQREELTRAVTLAERVSGRCFGVHVGPSAGDSRAKAEALHAQLPDPDNGIEIHLDPDLRVVEIVTGRLVKEVVTNRQVALAALSMQTAFAAGDLDAGLRIGLQQLAELARGSVSLHTRTP